jgi:hypothetical protein
MAAVGKTAGDGTFRATLKPVAGLPIGGYLVAAAPGFGVDWVVATEVRPDEPVTLKLTKDQPITGRVVNTEGRPLAGVAVAVESVAVAADDKLNDYLAGWTRNWEETLRTPRKFLYLPMDEVTGKVTTDRDGKFTLAGLGAQRIVSIRVSGPGMSATAGQVITRAGFNPKPYNEGAKDDRMPGVRSRRLVPVLYGPDAASATATRRARRPTRPAGTRSPASPRRKRATA